MGFHLAEFRGVPGSRVFEGDGFGSDGGELIQTGGERVVVVVDEFRGVIRQYGGEADSLWVREAERAEGEMDLRFLKFIVRLCLEVGMGMSMSIVIARWSEMWRLWLVR